MSVQRVYVRNYPHGTLGGADPRLRPRGQRASSSRSPRYQGVKPGDQVGQAGVENTYDNVLRGINGMTRVQVDAAGQPTGGVLSETTAQAGRQPAAHASTRRCRRPGRRRSTSFGTPGAFVAMNVNNGEILGLGSSPTYDPSVFTKPVIPRVDLQAAHLATRPARRSPTARSRACYPTGSTFKPITAIAALESGVDDSEHDDRRRRGRSRRAGSPCTTPAAAPTARSSCRRRCRSPSDVFFYNVGAMLYSARGRRPAEVGIRRSGSAIRPGIDLPGEVSGLLPTPAWRNKLYKEHQTDRPWTEGDNVNLAVGQGDLQADPLQMAVAYAAIANGGDVVRPHVGLEVEDPKGGVVQEINPAPQRHLDINPQYSHAILDGIHMAAQSPGGTSYPVFGNFPIPMAGKTGTAQRPGQQDQSWYVALAPYPNPQIVVAATIEQGGFGVAVRRAGGAPDPRRLLQHAQGGGQGGRRQGPVAGADPGRPRPEHGGRRGEPVLMVSDAYPRPFDERRSAGATERAGILGLDPLLFLAALGLIGFSLFTLEGGHGRRHPARPLLLRRPPGDLRRARGSR